MLTVVRKSINKKPFLRKKRFTKRKNKTNGGHTLYTKINGNLHLDYGYNSFTIYAANSDYRRDDRNRRILRTIANVKRKGDNSTPTSLAHGLEERVGNVIMYQ